VSVIIVENVVRGNHIQASQISNGFCMSARTSIMATVFIMTMSKKIVKLRRVSHGFAKLSLREKIRQMVSRIAVTHLRRKNDN